mmetsp:Transcript_26521/g.51840  ORF Transcript_26521/g.51840 Transcript_26521/m.51840 type:complete len:375 (+) Transcript_26521:31-1155(+)
MVRYPITQAAVCLATVAVVVLCNARSPSTLKGTLVRHSGGVVAMPKTQMAWMQQPRTRLGCARAEVQATESKPSTSTDFDLNTFLIEKKKSVEKALDASVQSNCKETGKICDAMRYSLLAGGKRVRPALCIAACEMLGGTEEMCMPSAVALEMIHTMSLIHDDLPAMDNDDLRRGMPTSHVKYGEDIAILAGDALLSESFAHVAKNTPKSVAPERIVEVIRILGDSVGPVGLAGGQVMDLECEAKKDVTTEELQWIHRHKTGALLIAAVASGAVLAGATQAEVDACIEYAEKIGLAFQVADDILDATQTSEVLGKTAGKDEAVDKTTYVKLLGLEGAKAEAQKLRDEAVAALEPFGEKAGPLKALADFIVNRNS